MQEEDHELIQMADYQLAPTRYLKKKCPEHPRYRLIDACDICFKTFCSRCTTREKCPKDGQFDQIMDPLQLLCSFIFCSNFKTYSSEELNFL